MSPTQRQQLVASPLTRFSSAVTAPQNMRDDLLDPARTHDSLIAYLTDVILGHDIPFEFTVVRTGHHNDGPHGHFGGFAADGWPLNSTTEGDFAPAQSAVMSKFLTASAQSKFARQIGLGGTSNTPGNMKLVAAVEHFPDGPQDHVHLGAVV
jgi:hypothetical protein